MSDDEYVQIVSNDGATMRLLKSHAVVSNVIKGMVDDENEDIPLPNVTGVELGRICEFLTLYGAHPFVAIKAPLPLKCTSLEAFLPPPLFSFIVDKTKEDISALLVAADYLDIPPLVNVCAAQMALFVHGMTDTEKLQFFNLDAAQSQSLAQPGGGAPATTSDVGMLG